MTDAPMTREEIERLLALCEAATEDRLNDEALHPERPEMCPFCGACLCHDTHERKTRSFSYDCGAHGWQRERKDDQWNEDEITYRGEIKWEDSCPKAMTLGTSVLAFIATARTALRRALREVLRLQRTAENYLEMFQLEQKRTTELMYEVDRLRRALDAAGIVLGSDE